MRTIRPRLPRKRRLRSRPRLYSNRNSMRFLRSAIVGLCVVVLAACWVAGLSGQVPAQLPMEPVLDSGSSVTGAFEGWYKNNDGTYSILVGYLNRNQKQTLDIPVGPDNRIDPGGPDQGQPTHFLP